MLLNCNGHGEPVGRTYEDGKPAVWSVFATAREAELDIVDSWEIMIQEFKEGDRDFDAIETTDYYVASALLHNPFTLEVDGQTFTA